MERLTIRSGDTSHENGVCCTHFKSKECLEVGGNCAYGCKWEEAAWERLAAYEDSLMSPEQCADAMRLSGLLNQYHGITVERVVELIEADKAGRSITLRGGWKFMGDTEKFEDFYANAERRIRELNKKRDDAMNETPQNICAREDCHRCP